MTKKDFVKQYLEPMVKALNKNVTKVEYVKATPSNEEYVNVWYTWDDGLGQTQSIRKQICVTANSNQAIATDVLKRAL